MNIEQTPDQAAPNPVTAKSRIASLDFIRGIAVMGILAANIAIFANPMMAASWPGAFITEHGPVSDALFAVQQVFVDGKMRGLFTLLFGAGLALFIDNVRRKENTERGGKALQLRRLFWLLLFGVSHYFLVWQGDILTLYAACGMICLVAIDWKPKTQVIVALSIFILGAALYSAMFGMMYWVANAGASLGPDLAEQGREFSTMQNEGLADGAIEAALITAGNYRGIVAHVWTDHRYDQLFAIMLAWVETIPLILIGMASLRSGMFDGRMDSVRQKRLAIRAVVAGLVIAVGLAAWNLSEGLSYLGTSFVSIGLASFAQLPLVVGIAALLSLYAGRATGWLGTRVTAAGRMAFSNYLGTSILMLPVMHGWGLGLYGELPRPALYGLMLIVWAIMLLWSKPWLERHRYGPLEWIWRCLTYWRVFPLRR